MAIDTVGYWCGEGDGSRCGYCSQETSSISTGLFTTFTSAGRYNALLDRGWRRSGQYLYKPTMDKTCCPQYTIKCGALHFQISRSQKKVLKRFQEFLTGSPGTLPKKGREDLLHNDSDQRGIQAVCNDNHDPLPTKPTISNNDCHNLRNNASNSHTNMQSSDKNICKQRTYKTGVQMSESKKKRDFRRLRKLKKIAKARDCSWETLDVRDLGVEPSPPSLEERLSAALKSPRFSLKLVLIDSETPDSCYNRTLAASHLVWKQYQMGVHGDAERECTEEHFQRFLCKPPFSEEEGVGGYHQHYFLDGVLVAVGVLDLLPRCVSSVYFYYDPRYAGLSFGTLSALFEVHLTQQLHKKRPELEWYYMGYYIHSCPKMKYKAKFTPSYLLCPSALTWWPILQCQLKLDSAKYSTFDPTTRTPDSPSEEDLSNLHVALNRRLCTYQVYKNLVSVDSYKEVLLMLVKLVGLENARHICIYNY